MRKRFRLAWASDLHLDLATEERTAMFLESIRETAPDALLVTGDISTCIRLRHDLDRISELGVMTYFVTGNHDAYGGGFDQMANEVRAACRDHGNLLMLGQGEIVPLTKDTALIGHPGWGDARAGAGRQTGLRMADWVMINELRELPGDILFDKLNALGTASADYIARVLPLAFAQADHIIIGTHVPPFPEGAYHKGCICNPDALANYVNLALGEFLLKVARDNHRKAITILAGHTHTQKEYHPLQNLTLCVAGAEYGHPRIADVLHI